jgi:hypothetical protein
LDNDFDHPMESVQYGHPERVTPFCLRDIDLLDDNSNLLKQIRDNHNSRVEVLLENPIVSRSIKLRCLSTWGAPATIFSVNIYP